MGGWRGLMLPQGTPKEISDVLVEAIKQTVQGESSIGGKTFPESMQIVGFNSVWRSPVQFQDFLIGTDEKFGKLLNDDAMQSVNEDRYSPMDFSGVVLGLMALTLVALIVPQ